MTLILPVEEVVTRGLLINQIWRFDDCLVRRWRCVIQFFGVNNFVFIKLMFEIGFSCCILIRDLGHHVVKLAHKSWSIIFNNRFWAILLFDLVDHSWHDGADSARFSFHIVHNSVVKFKIPVFWLVIDWMNLLLIEFVSAWGGWTRRI